MKKLSTQKVVRGILTGLLLFISISIWAAPPTFVDPIPEDITIPCITDFPPAVSLLAMDDMSMTFSVPSVDSPDPATINACTGGVITRTWTAIDGGGEMTVATQIITISADISAPVITLTQPQDTVSCELSGAGAMLNPLRYDVWITSLRLAISTHIDDCSGVMDISDDAPVSFEAPCNSLLVTFVITDNCGLSANWVASYTVIDTIAPVFIGTQNDTIVSCDGAIPPVPDVSAMDNCSGIETFTFNTFSTKIEDGSCQNYFYNISRTWLVRDSCGNAAQYSQLITVEDRSVPQFDAPSNLSIPCEMDASDVNITGSISNLTDNCTPIEDIVVAFVNDTIPGACPNNYIITRTWSATDACGNKKTKIQSISIYDIEPPTFVAPGDITVDCDDANDLMVTGVPNNAMDNCSGQPTINSFDVVVQGLCLYEYEIRRSWNVTDECGNNSPHLQVITVSDTTSPAFQSIPQDLSIFCGSGMDMNQLFADWVTNKAGAQALDNCSATNLLTWEVYNMGTTDAPSLPPVLCPSGDSILISRTVSFIVTDECGNPSSREATFRYIDDQAPVLSSCPPNVTLTSLPGDCTVTYELPIPTIEENCPSSNFSLFLSGNTPVLSNAQPGEESTTPVLGVELDMNIGQPLPINAQGDGILVIQMTSVNAFEDSEYFSILGEQGELIGITGHSPTICGDSDTTFMVPASWINNWAVDGVITLSFVPNVPADTRFAINPICTPAGTISATLDFNAGGFDALIFEYKIDEGVKTVGSFSAANMESLGFGDHQITYYAKDCANNIDSCTYTVSVLDEEGPSLTCLPDTTIYLVADTCTVSYALPLPAIISDNCSLEGAYNQRQPLLSTNALLTFNLDPNLGDYLASPKTITFGGVAANSIEDVTLVIELRGDFDAVSGYMEIFGEGNTLLGTTMGAGADCNTVDQFVITIPSATFNEWASDGQLEINAVPVQVLVPPGVPGDGINPCNNTVVMDGDSDGSSYLYMTLSYQKVLLDYYTTGALETPTSMMMEPQVKTTIELPLGQTEIHYIISDEAGNLDSCFYQVTILDTIAPVALCVDATTLFIEPSGLDEEVIDASALDLDSYDNCGITSLTLAPSTFACDGFGVLTNATLTVEDASGNQSTCVTIVTTSPILPEPTANSGLCGGDSLFLEANPPNGNSGAIYTFEWRDPSGELFATTENTVIPSIDANNEGAYSVTIRGLTGCEATGAVFVSIQDLPFTPALSSKETICQNEDLRLESGEFPVGSNVVFYWYAGLPPMGTLIDSTTTLFIDIAAPHQLGQNDYYLRIKANGCVSAPSSAWAVNVVQQPIAFVSYSDTIVCEGVNINLGTDISQGGLTYLWEGPNTFTSTEQYPTIGPLQDVIDEGYYIIVLNQDDGCFSLPDSTLVSIKPKPETPIISNNSPVCEGEQLTLLVTINNASAYHWENASGQITTTITPSLVIDEVNNNHAGDWRVFITQNGCDSDFSTPTTVIVNDRPQAEAYAVPLRVCIGDDFQLQALPDGHNYEWNGPGISTQSVQNPIITNSTTGNDGQYTLIVTSDEGCSNSSVVEIEIIDRINLLGVSSNAQLCQDGTGDIEMTVSTLPLDDGSYTYEWSGPSLYTSNSNPAIITGATAVENRGDYYLTVTSADNCETILEMPYFLEIRDNPEMPSAPAVVSGGVSHCEGDSLLLTTVDYSGTDVTYYWEIPGGMTLSTTSNKLVIHDILANMHTGNYFVYVIVDGCRSITSVPVYVDVFTVPVLEGFSNSPVCKGELIEFSTTFYEGATYVWGGPNNFNAGIQSPTFNSANQTDSLGTYFVVGTQNGCMSDTSYIAVAVKDVPLSPTIFDETQDSICSSHNAVTLELIIDGETTTDGAFYSWYNDVDGLPINTTPTLNESYIISDFAAYGEDIIYPFYVQAELNGCTSEFSSPYEVLINSIPAISAFAGIDSVICNNQVISINAEAPGIGTGVWSYEGPSLGVSISNPGMPNTSINGIDTSNSPAIFRWTISNGACENYDFDEVTISVGHGEDPISGGNIIACRDEIINLGASPVTGSSSIGEWTQTIGQVIAHVEIEEPFNPTTIVSGLLPNNIYTFKWTVSNECGVRENEILVYISDPFPDAGEDIIFCNEDATGELQAHIPSLGSVGQWQSLDPTVQIMDNLNDTTIVSNLKEGDNLFVWTVDEGICGAASSDTVVIIYKLPPVAVDDEISVEFDTPISFDVLINDDVSGVATVGVFIDPVRGDALSEEELITYTPPPNYVGQDYFTYEIYSEGCPSVTAEVDLIIGKGVGCDVPSIFTPNGDGVNDNFVIPCLLDEGEFPGSFVIIFNKWGDEVYRSSSPYKNNWTGTYNGEDLPPDTYFYIVDLGNGEDPFSGFIIIQK